jgi:hypothetical protein
MITFQGKRVSGVWKTILDEAWDQGVRFQLNSGQRTMAEQQALYDQNMSGGRPRPGRPLTAVPSSTAPHIKEGHVNHALDVDSSGNGENELQAWLTRQGVTVVNNVPGEAWHLDPVNEEQLKRVAERIRKENKRIRKAIKKIQRQIKKLRARLAKLRKK